MRVCVIGAGPAGLTTIKQLLDEGHAVTCFEKNDNVGGIWYRKADPSLDAKEMKVFDNLIQTISIKLMGYSDFMIPGDRVFYTHEEYQKYLEDYADKYNLRSCIIFNAPVIQVQKTAEKKWLVTSSISGKNKTEEFDAIAICTGPFNTPNFASVKDIDKFTGKVVHSSTYRNNSEFAGKRVLIVGLAESGADIVREISNVASQATLSITSYSFLVPRVFEGEHATDSTTCRSHHYEMYVRSQNMPFAMKAIFGNNILSRFIFFTFAWFYALLESLIGLFARPKKGPKREKNPLGQPANPPMLDIECENTKEHTDAMNEWNRRSHRGESNWTPKIIFSKNVSFIPNIVKGKLEVNDSGIERIEGSRVYFKNGENKEFDAIVLCTGFKQDFTKLGKDLAVKDNNVRNLYKHCFHPDHGGTLAFIGFVRPFTGGIPIVSEMQARYMARLLNKKLRLPDDIEKVIQKEKAWEDEMVIYSPKRTETIPSQILFIDSMAKEIGCFMPIWKLIFRPKLLYYIWFCPYNQACYRLTGPHSMYDSALNEIYSQNRGLLSSGKILWLFFMCYWTHPKYLVWPDGTGKASTKQHFLTPVGDK